MLTVRKKDQAMLLKERSIQAALLAVERLSSLLSDPDSSNADALKAATLIFDKIIPIQTGDGGGAGDYEITIKEEGSCQG